MNEHELHNDYPTGESRPSLVVLATLPIVTIMVLCGIALLIYVTKQKPGERGDGGAPLLLVETLSVAASDYQVVLESYGTVQPRTRSQLVAQVGGQILEVNPAFRDGGFFAQSDVLVAIDPRDYIADVQIADATLLDARQALADAEARAEQARADWARLGNEGEPPPLVAREPQRQAAAARLASAEAGLTKAQLALERTRVVAPYDGRVLSQDVDVGQVVAPNSALGSIYATDSVEVRLPLRNRDLGYIELPELDATTGAGAPVLFASELDGSTTWQGVLVRTEGAIDAVARQLHVTARVEDPYGIRETGLPIKIGQYVTARIEGRTLVDAIVVPNQIIYQGAFVYVVEDGVLDRRRIAVAWQNEKESIISAGLQPGEDVVTTQLGQVTSGTRVTVTGAAERDRMGASGIGGGGAAATGALDR
ncbi:MAG: efflux RND transporter periplasmic adaptor subunit [Pseudomonadota bacterium]